MSLDSQQDAQPRRPLYLVIALIAMWLVGMNAAAEGLVTIQIVRDPFAGAPSSVVGADSDSVLRAAWMTAMADHGRLTLPLGIAQLILGALLVLISARALFGRRASTSFALQVLFANAALLIVGYALREPVRATIVNTVVASGVEPRPEGMSAKDFDVLLRARHWWTFRFMLVAQLGALVLSAIALTRKSARELLTSPEPSPGEES